MEGILTHRRPRVVQVLVAISVVGLGLIPGGEAVAWPGDPDPTYGACGTIGIDVIAGTASAASAASTQPDAKVLVADYPDDRGLVMRLTAGHLDSSFGTGGRTRVRYPGTGRYFAVAPTVAGGAVAVGSHTDGAVTDSAIVRLRPIGTLDPTFHTNGKLNFNAGGNDTARGVASMNNGSILVAGNADSGGYVARCASNGSPDTA